MRNIPKSKTEIRRFLGLASYMRQFIQDFGRRTLPLTELLKESNPWEWTQKEQVAYDDIRLTLITAPQDDREFVLDPDASTEGFGGVLQQIDQDGI